MTRATALLLSLIGLAACQGDETISGYALSDAEWMLVDMGGTPFAARATITFPQQGKIVGQAPCNRYVADQTAPYPWFEAGPIGATKMACPDQAAEVDFFAGLMRVTLAEVSGDTLILSTEGGFEMLFRALP